MTKIFYSIGEVAEILDIPVSTVRFWEKNFDILRPQKTSAGHRKFTPADLENLKVIYHLVKEKGMTLEGARQRLRENPEGISHDQEIMDRLLSIRALLEEIRLELGDVPTVEGRIGQPSDASTMQLFSEVADNESNEMREHTEPEHIPTIIEQTLF